MSTSPNRWCEEPGRVADLGLLETRGGRATRGAGCLFFFVVGFFCVCVCISECCEHQESSVLLPRQKGGVTSSQLALQVLSGSVGCDQSVTVTESVRKWMDKWYSKGLLLFITVIILW